MSKLTTMEKAIKRNVNERNSIYISGFTHLINFSAAHEIIRQGIKDLNLIRLTPDVVYDQMVAAGSARKLTFSYLGNPGVGSLRCIRRAVEKGLPFPIELEEYTHGSLISALFAGGSNLPFYPAPSVGLSDLPSVNSNYGEVTDPFSKKRISVVAPLKPDVGIIHVQRADKYGNAQIWGIIGEQREVAFSSRKVIISAEEIVDHEVISKDPNRTIIPGFIVTDVVEEPYAAHPSYVQGKYDRDTQFYVEWNEVSKDTKKVKDFLQDWIYSVESREDYVKKLGKKKLDSLMLGQRTSGEVNYGRTL